MDRQFTLEQIHWEFEGTVSKKYKSTNHGAKSLTISGINYEFFPDSVWKKINIGDHIKKTGCETSIQINGQHYLLVQ